MWKPGLVTVPMHGGDLPVGTLRSIEKQADVRLRR
jgi:predicted RNA binding protein YcfA (HicA-like mRNA interferase family)